MQHTRTRISSAPDEGCRPRPRGHGYTLVELLAAISAVSVLVVAGSGSYQKLINEARTSDALGDLGEIVIEVTKYRTRHDGNLPSDLASIGLDRVDPWGNPYQYAAGSQVLIDVSLQGDDIRLDTYPGFDVYSLGPDGQHAAASVGSGQAPEEPEATDDTTS